MMNKYLEWVDKNVTKTYGKCEEVTEEMASVFPELKRVRGHYYCIAWGEREHWWLVDLDGNIVDPTKEQFPSKGNGAYQEWDESSEEPTGKCPNCSGYSYGGDTCCSDVCHEAYAAYCMEGF